MARPGSTGGGQHVICRTVFRAAAGYTLVQMIHPFGDIP